MEPRATIIVPIYNVEAYVGTCLESLLAQDFADFEVVCVDDGSTDASFEVARATVGDDPRFTFVRQENAGLSAARNAALSVARGRYVANLDSDDYYAPDTIGRLVRKADAENLDLLFFSAKTFYETGDLMRTHPEKQDNRPDIPGVFTGQQLYVEFERTGAFRPSACMYLVRRDLIERNHLRFEEGVIHEDLAFTTTMTPLAERAAFLNETYYQRRMRHGSIMTAKRGVRNIRGHLVASMRMESWLAQNASWLDDAFCDALCHRIHETWELVAYDTRELGDGELERFRDSLSREERIAYDLHGVELALAIGKVLDSTTFKAGRILMAAPTALKDRLTREA